jgi:hypothetical protein
MTDVWIRSRLLSQGHDRTSIDRLVRRGDVRVAFRGVYSPRSDDTLRTRWQAALATQPAGSALSHRTSAVAHDLPWAPDAWREAGRVDLTVPFTQRRRERDGIRLRRSALAPESIDAVDGLPVTSVARTLIDLIRARDVGRLLGLQLLDGALRFRRCTKADLDAELQRLAGSPGTARARTLCALARYGVDSPQETRLRLTLLDGGIRDADIDVNLEIRDDQGVVLARGDIGSRQRLMWGEYDGYAVHVEATAFGRDRIGDRWLHDRGWTTLRFSSADWASPDRIVRDWRRRWADAPARIAALDPRRSPEVAWARRQLDLPAA